jgi:serine/threonine protein kinase
MIIPIVILITLTIIDHHYLFTEVHCCSAVRSPFVVSFVGACYEPKVCFVMEYCKRGSLYHVLNDTSLELSWDRAFKWLTEMTQGLHLLHQWNPPIYHRDIKSLNILVTANWTAKLTGALLCSK